MDAGQQFDPEKVRAVMTMEEELQLQNIMQSGAHEGTRDLLMLALASGVCSRLDEGAPKERYLSSNTSQILPTPPTSPRSLTIKLSGGFRVRQRLRELARSERPSLISPSQSRGRTPPRSQAERTDKLEQRRRKRRDPEDPTPRIRAAQGMRDGGQRRRHQIDVQGGDKVDGGEA